MDIRKLQRAIVDGLEDVKAQDIRVFNTEHLSPLFERVIVASGTSNRQTKALASSVRDKVKSRGMAVMRTEGEGSGEWVIVDCGAAVAHIMQPAIRQYYNLEEIWGEKSVKMKMDGPAKPMPAKKKPSKPGAAAATKKTAAPSRKPAPGHKAVAGKAPAKKASAARPAPGRAAGKPPAKKLAKKTAPRRRA
jgi:ribosome-associated protein